MGAVLDELTTWLGNLAGAHERVSLCSCNVRDLLADFAELDTARADARARTMPARRTELED